MIRRAMLVVVVVVEGEEGERTIAGLDEDAHSSRGAFMTASSKVEKEASEDMEVVFIPPNWMPRKNAMATRKAVFQWCRRCRWLLSKIGASMLMKGLQKEGSGDERFLL